MARRNERGTPCLRRRRRTSRPRPTTQRWPKHFDEAKAGPEGKPARIAVTRDAHVRLVARLMALKLNA